MATLDTQRARSTGTRTWSLKRWLALSAALSIAIIAVALLVAFSASGSGGGY